ncbi:MAG TPA: ABC transporter permease [Tepidisphaeraceae bacterium]|jgi:spermidine/putrescine transport system permease protein
METAIEPSSQHRNARTGQWLALSPLVLWLLAFIIAPTLIMLVYSFCQRDELGEVVYSFTWDNYARAFKSTYLLILWRSTWLAGLTTIVCLLIGFPVAYTIARSGKTWRVRLLVLVMIPFWTSFLIRAYAWVTILKQQGLLNATLEYLRLIPTIIPRPLELLYTPTAVLIGLVYSFLPFIILPVYASLEKIDNSLIEAALDLGARPWRVLSSVILPLTKPGLAAGVLLVFVPAVGMFAVTDLVGGARTILIGNVIQNQFGQARDWPFGSALGIVLLLMFGLASLGLSFFIRRRKQLQ